MSLDSQADTPAPLNFVVDSQHENHAYDLMTPCILDRHVADGLVYGLSPARSGDMSIKGNCGVVGAMAKRQLFLDMVLRKFGYKEGISRADKAVYMLPGLEDPLLLSTMVQEKTIIKGPEAVVTNQLALLIMQPQDCLPIYLYDPKQNVYAFCHGSYHSINRDILQKTILLMNGQFGSFPENITAYAGPGIGHGWFSRRYLITQHPDYWEGSIDTMMTDDRVVRRDFKTNTGPISIFFPESNVLLNKFCVANSGWLKSSTTLVDAIDFALSRIKREVSQLSISLQKVIVSQLLSVGIKPMNLEIDQADTFQNSQRGLLFSHQGDYRSKATVRGNPIAIFGKLPSPELLPV